MGRRPTRLLRTRPGADARSTESSLLDLVLDALIAIDVEGRVTSWNAGAERLYGIARQDALGQPLTALYTYLWTSPEAERAALAALEAHGEWRGENVHVLRTGERRDVESTVRVLRGEDGARAGMVAVIRDVTERRRAETALHDSEAALDAFFAHSPGILNLDDGDLRYVKTDPTTPTYFGLTRESIVGRSVEQLAPEFMQRFGPMLREVIETGEPRLGVEVHSPVPGRPGEVAFWRASYFPVPLPGGKRGLGVIGVEITDLKKAEAALGSAHQKLRAHVEATPLALIEWDADYRVTSFSGRAEELFGWTAAEVIGRRIDEIPWVPEEDWPSVRAVMADMATGARPTNVNANRNVRKDGSVIYCEWYNSTLYDAHGKLASILSLVLDVSDRERAAAELRTANERLLEADRRKNEFLAVLSHELRNPLAPISNSIHLLDRVPPDSPQAARSRAVIARQAAHLTRLVEDLLDLTRISRGKVQLRRSTADLTEIVRATADDHRAVFEDAELALVLAVPEEPVPADVDPTRIAQVLGNLLSNAAKFTPARGKVTVRLEARPGSATISVQDTGIGLSPEQLARLFQPFVQEPRSLARSRGGLGLGLALSRGLVEAHGGTLVAASAGEGQGATFTLTLPLPAAS